ncbi:MAG: hypothetical protein ACMUEL_04530 [Flavobacteriales bacterium Tduv]
MINWEVMKKEIKKCIKKTKNKSQPGYSGIALFNDDAFESLV